MTTANESSEKYIAELLEKMADSDRKARSAEEYLGMREDLLKQLAELQEKMQESKKKYEHQISELEREHVKDRCGFCACRHCLPCRSVRLVHGIFHYLNYSNNGNRVLVEVLLLQRYSEPKHHGFSLLCRVDVPHLHKVVNVAVFSHFQPPFCDSAVHYVCKIRTSAVAIVSMNLQGLFHERYSK